MTSFGLRINRGAPDKDMNSIMEAVVHANAAASRAVCGKRPV